MSSDNKGKLGDILKTVVSTGAAAASMGGEAMKGLVEDAKTAKSELMTSVKAEVKHFLERINIRNEIDRVLEDYDLEVQAKVSFKRKKPKTKTDADT
jgi:hypothetical protein